MWTSLKSGKEALSWLGFKNVFYFEWIYGHTCQHQIDLQHHWGLHRNQLNKVRDSKLALEVAGLQSWPQFASFEEDHDPRKKTKRMHYNGKRVIMWDMTNISAYKFENAKAQRATWSEYYAANCFKAAVFTQMCGWLGNEDCWVGVVSDLGFNELAGHMKNLKRNFKKDLVDIMKSVEHENT